MVTQNISNLRLACPMVGFVVRIYKVSVRFRGEPYNKTWLCSSMVEQMTVDRLTEVRFLPDPYSRFWGHKLMGNAWLPTPRMGVRFALSPLKSGCVVITVAWPVVSRQEAVRFRPHPLHMLSIGKTPSSQLGKGSSILPMCKIRGIPSEFDSQFPLTQV